MADLGQRLVVTVDGLAGSGKTTISRMLAQRLSFAHLNSGLLYRAVAWLALRSSVDPNDGKALQALLGQHRLELRSDIQLSSRMWIDGADVTTQLHTPQVSEATSRAATRQEVRSSLVELQRGAFPGCSLVAEGRDMGTVIFPNAQMKFFIEASEEVRIQRRIAQLASPGASLEQANRLKNEMKIEIAERDKRDAERALAPVRAAPDAVIVDNSSQTLTQVLDSMYDALRKKGYVGSG